MTHPSGVAKRRTALSIAIATTCVAMIAGVSSAASAAPATPPFNQDGIQSNFQVGCFFTTDQNGNALWVDDGAGGHEADPSNPADLALLMQNAPSFYQDSMDAMGDTQYPFPVSVDVAIGTESDSRLPENPLPGETYAGPFSSNLSLRLPDTVAHVIRETAGYDGLIGSVTAKASIDTETASGPVSSPLESDPFSLGTAGNPVVAVDSIAEIPLNTVGLWRDLSFPADWNTTSADVVFGGFNAVSVAVQVVDQADPSSVKYNLNLTCFPNGTGGTANVPVTVGQLAGNFVGTAPTITSAAPANAAVGKSYSHQLVAAGDPTITYAVTSGVLPNGLTLDAATGLISGVPTAEGSFSFSITATNGYGADEKTYAVTVTADTKVEVAPKPPVTPVKPGTTPTTPPVVEAAPVAKGSLAVTGDNEGFGGLIAGVVALLGGAGLITARHLLRKA